MRDDLDITALQLLAYPGNQQLQSIRRTNILMPKELQVEPLFADGIPRVRSQCLQHLEFALTQFRSPAYNFNVTVTRSDDIKFATERERTAVNS